MTENKALLPVPQREMTLAETLTLGETLAKSGFFSDTKSAAQAVAKILAGAELGFGPMASMTGIHIIQNKVAIGANLMGAAVKRDPRYDYHVIALTDERAEVAFYEHGKEVGRSTFSIQDAQAAGLNGKPNWTKFPRNMLFSRAMSNGVRWYCPDAFGGNPTYTPDELGAEVDDEGNVIEGQFTAASATSDRSDVGRRSPTTGGQMPAGPQGDHSGRKETNDKRPYGPEVIKAKLAPIAAAGSKAPITDKQRGLLVSKLNECFAEDPEANSRRHSVTQYLFGFESLNDAKQGHADAILKWLLLDGKQDSTGDYPLHPKAPAEAADIFDAAVEEAGQQRFDDAADDLFDAMEATDGS